MFIGSGDIVANCLNRYGGSLVQKAWWLIDSRDVVAHYERCGGGIGEKSVILILRKNRPVKHTFEI
jgi:hypothetical protein